VNFVRYGIPAVLILLGLVALFAGPDGARLEGWAMFTGAGLSVLLLNWLYRLGVSGDTERDSEHDAREYLDEHGQWPNEATATDGRRWNLPMNVATPESEAEEARRAGEDPRSLG
jgi:hypothetical protein